MRDLFNAESLSVRRARRSKKRGPLEWTICDDHHAPSYVSYLLYWHTYLHRTALSGSRGYIDTRLLDDETRALFNDCIIVQYDLTAARNHENRLGIRWNRETVVNSIRSGSFTRDLRSAYSHGLVYLLLERSEEVQRWTSSPIEWIPPKTKKGNV